jgi:hypothetical protein
LICLNDFIAEIHRASLPLQAPFANSKSKPTLLRRILSEKLNLISLMGSRFFEISKPSVCDYVAGE